MSEPKPDRSSLRQARAPEDLADGRFVGGATAAEVVGGADLRRRKVIVGKQQFPVVSWAPVRIRRGRLTVSGSCGSTSEQEDL